MPVVVIATLAPKPEHRDAVRGILTDSIPSVHLEKGCQLYALHETGDSFVFVEQWVNKEALEAHGSGPVMRLVQRQLDGRLKSPPTVLVGSPLPAGRPEQGQVAPGP